MSKTAIISMAYGHTKGAAGNADFGRRGGRRCGCRCKCSNSLGCSTARLRAARTEVRLRECSVEGLGIDRRGDRLDNVGTPIRPITSGTVGVVGAEPVQDAGLLLAILYHSLLSLTESESRMRGATRLW